MLIMTKMRRDKCFDTILHHGTHLKFDGEKWERRRKIDDETRIDEMNFVSRACSTFCLSRFFSFLELGRYRVPLEFIFLLSSVLVTPYYPIHHVAEDTNKMISLNKKKTNFYFTQHNRLHIEDKEQIGESTSNIFEDKMTGGKTG